MTESRNKYAFLWVSLLIVAGVALMQVLGNTVGLIAVMLLFGAIVVLAAVKDMAIPLLMFFLPWSPLIKLVPGSTSMYTIALIAVLLKPLLAPLSGSRFFEPSVIAGLLLAGEVIKDLSGVR